MNHEKGNVVAYVFTSDLVVESFLSCKRVI